MLVFYLVQVHLNGKTNMKIRSGFISNSSSSSFICDVCDYLETSWDGDFNVLISFCNAGHEVCSEHIDNLPIEHKAMAILGDSNFINELDSKDLELIKRGDREIINLTFSNYRSQFNDIPEIICPICSFIIIPDWCIIKYLLEKNNKTKKEITEEIKNKYGTLRNFK